MKYPARYRCAFLLLAGACIDQRPASDTEPSARTDSRSEESIGQPADGGFESRIEGPLLTVGAAAGEELFRVVDAARLPDGGLVIANRGSNELRFHSPSDDMRIVGAEGRGPAEFIDLKSVLVRGDSVLAWDAALQKVVIFDTAGQYVRAYTLQDSGDPRAPLRLYRLEQVFHDSLLFLTPAYFPADMAPEPAVFFDTVPNLLYTSRGEVVRRIGVAGMDTYATPRRSGDLPFGRITAVAASDSQVFIGHGTTQEVLVYALDGTLQHRIVVPTEARRVTAGAIREFIDSAMAIVPPSRASEYREYFESIPFPSMTPHHGAIEFRGSNELWVQEFSPYWLTPSLRWYIIGTDGILLGIVELPRPLKVLELGNRHVVGVERGDLGVELVKVFSIAPEK